jgi:hypothetical protein
MVLTIFATLVDGHTTERSLTLLQRVRNFVGVYTEKVHGVGSSLRGIYNAIVGFLWNAGAPAWSGWHRKVHTFFGSDSAVVSGRIIDLALNFGKEGSAAFFVALFRRADMIVGREEELLNILVSEAKEVYLSERDSLGALTAASPNWLEKVDRVFSSLTGDQHVRLWTEESIHRMSKELTETLEQGLLYPESDHLLGEYIFSQLRSILGAEINNEDRVLEILQVTKAYLDRNPAMRRDPTDVLSIANAVLSQPALEKHAGRVEIAFNVVAGVIESGINEFMSDRRRTAEVIEFLQNGKASVDMIAGVSSLFTRGGFPKQLAWHAIDAALTFGLSGVFSLVSAVIKQAKSSQVDIESVLRDAKQIYMTRRPDFELFVAHTEIPVAYAGRLEITRVRPLSGPAFLTLQFENLECSETVSFDADGDAMSTVDLQQLVVFLADKKFIPCGRNTGMHTVGYLEDSVKFIDREKHAERTGTGTFVSCLVSGNGQPVQVIRKRTGSAVSSENECVEMAKNYSILRFAVDRIAVSPPWGADQKLVQIPGGDEVRIPYHFFADSISEGEEFERVINYAGFPASPVYSQIINSASQVFVVKASALCSKKRNTELICELHAVNQPVVRSRKSLNSKNCDIEDLERRCLASNVARNLVIRDAVFSAQRPSLFDPSRGDRWNFIKLLPGGEQLLTNGQGAFRVDNECQFAIARANPMSLSLQNKLVPRMAGEVCGTDKPITRKNLALLDARAKMVDSPYLFCSNGELIVEVICQFEIDRVYTRLSRTVWLDTRKDNNLFVNKYYDWGRDQCRPVDYQQVVSECQAMAHTFIRALA